MCLGGGCHDGSHTPRGHRESTSLHPPEKIMLLSAADVEDMTIDGPVPRSASPPLLCPTDYHNTQHYCPHCYLYASGTGARVPPLIGNALNTPFLQYVVLYWPSSEINCCWEEWIKFCLPGEWWPLALTEDQQQPSWHNNTGSRPVYKWDG